MSNYRLITWMIATWFLIPSQWNHIALSQTTTPPSVDPAEESSPHERIDKLWGQAQHLHSEGKLSEAIKTTQQMLELERQSHTGPHDDLAVSLEFLAELQKENSEYAAAVVTLQELTAVCTQVHGKQHYLTIDAWVALANVRLLQRLTSEQHQRLADANRLHVECAEAFNEGQLRKALDLEMAVLKVRRELLGEQNLDVVRTVENLAFLHRESKDWKQAELHYREALRIRKNLLGRQHPDTATGMANLAKLYQALSDYSQALPLYRQSLEINKRALGEEQPDTATSLNNLATLYKNMGDHDRALPLLQQSLEIYKRALGEDHPNTVTSIGNLATLHQEMGDYAQALALCKRSLEIRKRVLGRRAS